MLQQQQKEEPASLQPLPAEAFKWGAAAPPPAQLIGRKVCSSWWGGGLVC